MWKNVHCSDLVTSPTHGMAWHIRTSIHLANIRNHGGGKYQSIFILFGDIIWTTLEVKNFNDRWSIKMNYYSIAANKELSRFRLISFCHLLTIYRVWYGPVQSSHHAIRLAGTVSFLSSTMSYILKHVHVLYYQTFLYLDQITINNIMKMLSWYVATYDNVHYCACHVSNSILTRGYLWLSYHLYYLYQNIARSLKWIIFNEHIRQPSNKADS